MFQNPTLPPPDSKSSGVPQWPPCRTCSTKRRTSRLSQRQVAASASVRLLRRTTWWATCSTIWWSTCASWARFLTFPTMVSIPYYRFIRWVSHEFLYMVDLTVAETQKSTQFIMQTLQTSATPASRATLARPMPSAALTTANPPTCAAAARASTATAEFVTRRRRRLRFTFSDQLSEKTCRLVASDPTCVIAWPLVCPTRRRDLLDADAIRAMWAMDSPVASFNVSLFMLID